MARRKQDHELLRRRKGTGSVSPTGYMVRGKRGVPLYEHRLIAERVLGEPLPPDAEIHHWDGNKLNNAHSNLVICENTAYHKLLHLRQQAMAATGDPRQRRCVRCHGWDAVENMVKHSRGQRFKHRRCENEYKLAKKKGVRHGATA